MTTDLARLPRGASPLYRALLERGLSPYLAARCVLALALAPR